MLVDCFSLSKNHGKIAENSVFIAQMSIISYVLVL